MVGDHPNASTIWLDEKASNVGPCPQCASPRVLRRERANYGPALPIHRHVVEVCLDCDDGAGRWSVSCIAALDELQRGAR